VRVAHLTDLHFTVGLDGGIVDQATEMLLDEMPDLVICTGDVVSRDTEENMRRAYARED
jgi:3',5'-cyclic AMP phosphodiesterase CpdA